MPNVNSALAAEEASEAKKPARQILQEEISVGLTALRRPFFRLFLSSFSAGLDIGFSLFLMATVLHFTEGELPRPIVRILVANMYAVGFIFVVLGRSELFTEHTTLAVLPVLNRQASVVALARLWVVVYIANLMGAAAFAALAQLIGPMLGIFGYRELGQLAHQIVDHPGEAILLSAILAGWLMGLMSWLVTAGRDTISHLVLIWLIATAIGLAQLHHVIAGSVEVLAGVISGHGASLEDFGRFLGWATLGNVLGGTIFVALLKFGHATQEGSS
jgi:formate/nitrite transporter FocA (FNT family)